MIARLKEERNTYVILMGDLVESIACDDKRFSAEIHDARLLPFQQMEDITAAIKPIKKKVLACLTGNHELHLHRYGDMTRMLCKDADIPYGGYSSKVAVRYGKCGPPAYKIYVTHGRLSINSSADDPVRRQSNMRLSLKRRLQHLAGDCAVMATGHCHRLITVKPVPELYMTDDGHHLQAHYTESQQHGAHIDPNLRWYAATGSFLKNAVIGATSYSEQAMYAPNELGYAEIVVEDGRVVRVEEKHLGADHVAE